MAINMYNTKFESGSVGINNYFDNSDNYYNSDILESIGELKILLNDAEILSKRISELEEAVKEKDESRIATFAKSVTSGTFATLLSKLASENLLQLLGLK